METSKANLNLEDERQCLLEDLERFKFQKDVSTSMQAKIDAKDNKIRSLKFEANAKDLAYGQLQQEIKETVWEFDDERSELRFEITVLKEEIQLKEQAIREILGEENPLFSQLQIGFEKISIGIVAKMSKISRKPQTPRPNSYIAGPEGDRPHSIPSRETPTQKFDSQPQLVDSYVEENGQREENPKTVSPIRTHTTAKTSSKELEKLKTEISGLKFTIEELTRKRKESNAES
jgi:hypothetical protein